MNAHRWPLTGPNGGAALFLAHPVSTSGVSLTHTPIVDVHRFIAAPTDSRGDGHQDNRQVNSEENNSSGQSQQHQQQLLDITGFPPLHQVSVDMMTSWTDTLQQQQRQQQQQQEGQQQQQQTSHEEEESTFPSNHTGVASSVALQDLHLQLTDMDRSVQKPKRKRNAKPAPETWKKNVRKTKRAKGEAYQSANGKEVPAKSIKDVDCSKCRLMCCDNICIDQRRSIFESYWGTGSYVRQRDFICSHVIEEEKARTTVKGEPFRRREFTRQYWLPRPSGKLVRVCKSFFLATLDIGCKTIDYALKKRKGGFFCDDDQRGRHEPTNKVKEESLDAIRHHIESFWHLNLSPSKKKKNGRIILPANLNIRKMYQMYKDSCWDLGDATPQKEHVYRRIFNMEYNITFHEPKKEVVIKGPQDQLKFTSSTTSTSSSTSAAQSIATPSSSLTTTNPLKLPDMRSPTSMEALLLPPPPHSRNSQQRNATGEQPISSKDRQQQRDSNKDSSLDLNILHPQTLTSFGAPPGGHHLGPPPPHGGAHSQGPAFPGQVPGFPPRGAGEQGVNMSMAQLHIPQSFIHHHPGH